jgi:uncharacterized protein YndB with AHSA1/START domain
MSEVRIAPVRKTLVVNASPERAFEVFTAGIDRWWPKTHHLGSAPLRAMVLEPRLGGRFISRHEDGSEVEFGRVLAWEPPQRLVVSWMINASWKVDASVASEFEVNFRAAAPGTTSVALEHRNFEVLGEQDGLKLRGDVSNGWPAVLEHFRQWLAAPSVPPASGDGYRASINQEQ